MSKAKQSVTKPKQPCARAAAAGDLCVRSRSRAETLIELLRRPEGATIDKIVKATGWLPHSIRGFIAGALKTRHGLTTSSERIEDKRVYRIAGETR